MPKQDLTSLWIVDAYNTTSTSEAGVHSLASQTAAVVQAQTSSQPSQFSYAVSEWHIMLPSQLYSFTPEIRGRGGTSYKDRICKSQTMSNSG